jgi:hypothetical protein
MKNYNIYIYQIYSNGLLKLKNMDRFFLCLYTHAFFSMAFSCDIS